MCLIDQKPPIEEILMKKSLVIIVALLSTVMAGCGPKVPTCNDIQTTDLVVNIAKDELIKQIGQEPTNLLNLAVTAIRTTETNSKTGAHQCAGQLEISGPGGTNAVPITYTVEMTDDGKQFFVNVFGL